MITKNEIQDTIDKLIVRPRMSHIMVLVQAPKEKTESGIIKGDAVMADEKMDAFLTVIALAEDVTDIKVFDRVYVQGTVTTFSGDAMPDELDISPEGYLVGIVPSAYVKMIA